jgi:hypothetical protein
MKSVQVFNCQVWIVDLKYGNYKRIKLIALKMNWIINLLLFHFISIVTSITISPSCSLVIEICHYLGYFWYYVNSEQNFKLTIN